MDAFTRLAVHHGDKEIEILGPSDLALYVDFDDVDHSTVEELVDEMLDALNDWWRNR